jgi:hypothetical protein
MSVKNKWLIKSDYKILGPYSYEQVEDLIMKKQISLIDEIRDMDLRWSYVREVPDFKPLVDAVREEIDKKSDMTQTVQTSVTLQRTATSTADSIGTVTGSHRLDFSQVELPGLPVETPAHDLTTELPRKEINRKINTKAAFDNSMTEEKPRVALGIKALIAVAIVVLCAGAGWYYYTTFSQSKNEKHIFQQIRKYNLYAQDDKSIELFKRLPLSSQDKIVVDIIPLWLKLEAAGAMNSSRMLDLMTRGKVIGNERKSQYQLVKFNKAFNLGDIQNARDSLVKAIDLDPSATDVKENDAILSFAQKKYNDSARIFKNLYDVSNQGRYLYGHVLSQINGKTINGPVAFQILENHTRNRVEFNKELLFLQIYMIKKGLIDNPDLYREHFTAFVDFPHQMTKYFKLSSLVNRTSYNWEDLEILRRDLVPLLDNRDAALLNINFYLEKGDLAQAQEVYHKSQNILSENDRYNLDVAINYFKKTYQTVINFPTEGKNQSLATQLYMLMMHDEIKSSNARIMQYINLLMKDKQLFSNWALLMTAKMPEDKEQMKTLINGDRLYTNEFLPYLEFKAMANND